MCVFSCFIFDYIMCHIISVSVCVFKKRKQLGTEFADINPKDLATDERLLAEASSGSCFGAVSGFLSSRYSFKFVSFTDQVYHIFYCRPKLLSMPCQIET